MLAIPKPFQNSGLNKAGSTIIIIPGEHDIYDNLTPPTSIPDLQPQEGPCLSTDNDEVKTYTKMRVPNWLVAGYESVDLDNAICLINHWSYGLLRMDSASQETVSEIEECECGKSQGKIVCPPGQDSRSGGVILTVKCPTTIKAEVTRAAKHDCSSDKKSGEHIVSERNTCSKPSANKTYGCGPCCCDPTKGMQAICTCWRKAGAEPSSTLEENNAAPVGPTSLTKNKKEVKTKKSKTKESKTFREKRAKVKNKELPSKYQPPVAAQSSQTSFGEVSSSLGAEVPTYCSQECCNPSPQQTSGQKPCQNPTQHGFAEITVYRANGTECIKQLCDPSIAGHLLMKLFGSSEYSDINDIEIKFPKRMDLRTGVLHKDLSTAIVSPCSCQTQLPEGVDSNDDDDECCQSVEESEGVRLLGDGDEEEYRGARPNCGCEIEGSQYPCVAANNFIGPSHSKTAISSHRNGPKCRPLRKSCTNHHDNHSPQSYVKTLPDAIERSLKGCANNSAGRRRGGHACPPPHPDITEQLNNNDNVWPGLSYTKIACCSFSQATRYQRNLEKFYADREKALKINSNGYVDV